MAAKKKLTEAPADPNYDPDDPGYIGPPTDPTPNEAYTVTGVLNEAPTPETDEQARWEAFRATHGHGVDRRA